MPQTSSNTPLLLWLGALTVACSGSEFSGVSPAGGKAKNDESGHDAVDTSSDSDDDGDDEVDDGVDSEKSGDDDVIVDEDGTDSLSGSLVIDGFEIVVKGQCKVAHVSYTGGGYIPKLDKLPANLTVEYIALNDGPLTVDRLKSIDLIAVSDADIGTLGVAAKGLGPDDLSLLRQLYKQGVDFFFGFDNGSEVRDGKQYDAGKLSRTAIRFLDEGLELQEQYDGSHTPAVVLKPDLAKYPFLSGVSYDFSGSYATPGIFTKVTAPTSCVIIVDGKCAVAYTPAQDGHGFSYMSGNANVGNELLFGRMVAASCGG